MTIFVKIFLSVVVGGICLGFLGLLVGWIADDSDIGELGLGVMALFAVLGLGLGAVLLAISIIGSFWT